MESICCRFYIATDATLATAAFPMLPDEGGKEKAKTVLEYGTRG
jgi:hypothetical protein